MSRRRRLYTAGLDSGSRVTNGDGVLPRRVAFDFDPLEEATTRWKNRGWPGPDEFAAAQSVLIASQMILTAVDAVLEPFGLTFARYEALALLSFSKEGRLPIGKMSARLRVHPASMTNTVTKLEADGLLRRLSDSSDRRTVIAEITDAGWALVQRTTPALAEAQFGTAGLNPYQREAIVTIIRDFRIARGEFVLSGQNSGIGAAGYVSTSERADQP
jgi:DNA-binding MarR family transcriptional regulator